MFICKIKCTDYCFCIITLKVIYTERGNVCARARAHVCVYISLISCVIDAKYGSLAVIIPSSIPHLSFILKNVFDSNEVHS
jgi:hypothetical protein